MRKYKKVLVVIASCILFLVTAAIALSVIYEDRINNYLVSTLNERLEAEIRAKEISFSLIEKFPFASVRLDSMTVIPKDKTLPPLYSAKTTFLEFNVLDIFSGNYSIRNIDIRKGNLNVVTINGRGNYELIKDTGKDSKFSFALRNVRISDLSFTVDNRDNNFILKAILNTAAINGKFSESEYNLTAKLNGKFREIGKENTTFLKGKTFRINSELYVKSKVYSIKYCDLTLQDLNFKMNGDLKDNGKRSTSFKIKGDDIAIMDLYKLLPEDLMPQELDDYESEGNLDFSASVEGPLDSAGLNAEFNIHKGKLIYKPDNLVIRNINLSGKILNGNRRTLSSSKVQISNFHADTKQGNVSGSFDILNFKEPHLNINLRAHTSLEQIMPFIKQNLIREAKGKVELQAYYNGPLKKAKTKKDLTSVKGGGMIKLKNVSMILPAEKVDVKNLNANLLLDKNDLMITTLDLNFNGSDFKVRGRFDNIIPSLFSKDEYMQAYLDLESQEADLLAFLPEMDNSGRGGALAFPFNEGRMNMSFEKAKYKRFEASSVTGTLNLKNNLLTAENIRFSTMSGDVIFNGAADFTTKGISVKGNADLQKINISNLFYVFNNFGQSTLTEEKIKGIADSRINFQCFWNQKLQFDPGSLNALCDISIEKGELLNFEPLFHLSNYIALSELKHIRFSKLQNNFIVKDNKIIFPEMVIHSNALNLTYSGVHYFTNQVDYHFELSLNDLLWQKAKKAKPVNEEFGVEEDDGLGKIKLHLSMTGNIDSPVLSYDKKSFRKDLQEEAKQEKQIVKGLLKKDLGLYKADSSVQVPAQKKEKSMQVEWNEGDPKRSQPATKENPKQDKEKGKVGKLLNKITKPENEEKAGENSDDFN